ncbi:MAG: galactokinase [Candidatus Eremiobacteraeota bacterium]|nr:galactokinase [Candidatus Eremiobacteraeota bacterium]
MITDNEITSMLQRFIEKYNRPPIMGVRAPGRVNLIGEHTDYNQGFVFPAAIEREIRILASPISVPELRMYSMNYEQYRVVPLTELEFSKDMPWSNYICGVVDELIKAGYTPGGCEMLIWGDIPIGAGLSSSAAIEVASACMFRRLFNLFDISDRELALIAQKAENNFIGVNCGIMDQFVSLMGWDNHALLIDCKSLNAMLVPIPRRGKISIVICNSKVPRELTDSEYNRRREECEEGLRLLKEKFPSITSIRDVLPGMWEEIEHTIPMPVRKRCRHVIYENQRTLDAAEALKNDNPEFFGELMNLSHKSLKDDFEVSRPELDCLVSAAWEIEECFGSKLTGAGFGGCTVSLVENSGIERFKEHLKTRYMENFSREPDFVITQATSGASLLRIPHAIPLL